MNIEEIRKITRDSIKSRLNRLEKIIKQIDDDILSVAKCGMYRTMASVSPAHIVECKQYYEQQGYRCDINQVENSYMWWLEISWDHTDFLSRKEIDGLLKQV